MLVTAWAGGGTSSSVSRRSVRNQDVSPRVAKIDLMPGEEIAIGTAAGAAKKALSTSKEEEARLAELASDTPAMRDAATAYAKRVAIKQEFLLTLYKPLAMLVGRSKDYFANDFPSEMAAKVADVPEAELVSPKPSVAVPAMEALGYSLDEPDLKEMYLNLLATATDGRVANDAHPSFAEIIRQLSPQEAQALRSVLGASNHPIVTVIERKEGTNYGTLYTHLMDWRKGGKRAAIPSSPAWIDNWIRLGLVAVDYTTWITADGAYEWVDTRPEVIKFREAVGAPGTVDITKGYLRTTDFGARFAQAVLT